MNAEKLKHYYKHQSLVYDATRWSFLFGRSQSVQELKKLTGDRHNLNILEIGCGTGANLENLVAAYPQASVYGIDLSEDMLRKARKKPALDKVTFKNEPYGQNQFCTGQFDLIACIYSLSMFDNAEDTLPIIKQHLAPNGYLIFVDFHSTPFQPVDKWMRLNHVHFASRCYELLCQDPQWNIQYNRVRAAYGGLWKYFLLILQKTA